MSNIHKLIEHLVNNWSNNLSEALAPRVKQQLMDKFKQEADDFDIKIDDKQLSDYIDYFDARLKNNPKVTEKDLAKYPLKTLNKNLFLLIKVQVKKKKMKTHQIYLMLSIMKMVL